MRITIVTNAFGCGGSERVVALWCKGFTDRGHQVTVLNMSHPNNMRFFPIPASVEVISLNMMQTSQNGLQAVSATLKRLTKMRRIIPRTKPDRVITLYPQLNVLTILALSGTGIPVYVSEHCDPNLCANGEIWETLRPWIYPWAARVVSVSRGVDRALNYLPSHKRCVIFNPAVQQIAKSPLAEIAGANPDRPWIVSMGRLSGEKGYDLLISAFARLADRYPDWQLVIMGEGADRTPLEALRDRLGLTTRILMPGAIQSIAPVLHKAEFFVMASRFEGFPMAHLEALGSGLPVVATDCESGPREIVRHEVDGLLVKTEDVEALTDGMELMMKNPALRRQFAQRAPEVIDRFGMDKVMDDWALMMNLEGVAIG